MESDQAFLQAFKTLDGLDIVESGEMSGSIGYFAKVEYPKTGGYTPKLDEEGLPGAVALLRATYYEESVMEDGSFPLYCQAHWWYPRGAERTGLRGVGFREWRKPIDLDWDEYRVLRDGSIRDRDGNAVTPAELFLYLLGEHCETAKFSRWVIHAVWTLFTSLMRWALFMIACFLALLLWLLGRDPKRPNILGINIDEDFPGEKAADQLSSSNPSYGVEQGETLNVFGYEVAKRLAFLYVVILSALGLASFFWLNEACPWCYRLAKGFASISLLAFAVGVGGIALLSHAALPLEYLIRPVNRWLYLLSFRGFSTSYYRIGYVIAAVMLVMAAVAAALALK
jgi:hypothetical protein